MSPQILFVEDTSDTRDLVEFGLSRDGFQVTSAQTAEDGLTLARRGGFALLLLDVGLPDKDGLELCREIREFDARTPILFYTAYADLLDREQAAAAGAQGCLRKPEDTPRLASAIREIIAARSVEQSIEENIEPAAKPVDSEPHR